jgi:hypothetical protein
MGTRRRGQQPKKKQPTQGTLLRCSRCATVLVGSRKLSGCRCRQPGSHGHLRPGGP